MSGRIEESLIPNSAKESRLGLNTVLHFLTQVLSSYPKKRDFSGVNSLEFNLEYDEEFLAHEKMDITTVGSPLKFRCRRLEIFDNYKKMLNSESFQMEEA